MPSNVMSRSISMMNLMNFSRKSGIQQLSRDSATLLHISASCRPASSPRMLQVCSQRVVVLQGKKTYTKICANQASVWCFQKRWLAWIIAFTRFLKISATEWKSINARKLTPYGIAGLKLTDFCLRLSDSQCNFDILGGFSLCRQQYITQVFTVLNHNTGALEDRELVLPFGCECHFLQRRSIENQEYNIDPWTEAWV